MVKEIEALGARAIGVRANVGSFAESQAMVERAEREFGRLDILVCNAGVFHHTPFLELSEAEWDEVLTVDLKGIFNCARAAIGPMARRGWGRVICVTAISGLTGYPEMAHIAAPTTGSTRCSSFAAIRKATASPKPTFGADSPALAPFVRIVRVPPRYGRSLRFIEIATSLRRLCRSSCQSNSTPGASTIR